MTWPSALMIRLSLIYFLLAFTFGALLLIEKAMHYQLGVWFTFPVHTELALFGWVIQLVLGTAYWILPRYVVGKPRDAPWKAWAMIAGLNLGILANVAVSMLYPGNAALLLPGRILEASAIVMFVHLHWDRIYGYGHAD